LRTEVEVAGRREIGCVDGGVEGSTEGGDVKGESDVWDGSEDEVEVWKRKRRASEVN